jgi:DNA polymerase-3 subunit beta
MSTLNAKQLKAGLALVSKAVTTKSTLPILGNVKIAVQSAGVSLAATNLELTIETLVPYSGLILEGDPWATTVPAQTFSQLTAASESEQIDLEFALEGETMTFKAGKSKAAIKGIPAEEFPLFPVTQVEMGSMSAAVLKRAFKRVVIAASKDMARPALQSVQLFKNGHVRLTAADGFRLATQRLDVELNFPGKANLLIPANAAGKLADILPDDETLVTLRTNAQESTLQFAWDGVNAWVQLLDFNFPDWQAIVPKSFKDEVALPVNDSLSAIRRAEIFARAANMVVTFLPSEQGLVVIGRDTKGETGKSETVLNVTPPSDKVSFNTVFARQAIEAVGGGEVKMCVNGGKSPVVFTDGTDDYLHLLMPMVTPEDIDAAAVAAATDESPEA